MAVFSSSMHLVLLRVQSTLLPRTLTVWIDLTVLNVPAVYDIGTEAPPARCGYSVRSENKKTGFIMSPTFPGIYADNMFCYYKLQGNPMERIRLQFVEFSLYHGGE